MTTHISFRAEQILGEQYGLTPHEVTRALSWARTAKLAASRKDAKDKAEAEQKSRRQRAVPTIPPVRKEPKRAWCAQCERNVTEAEAERCSSKWCKAKPSTGITPVFPTETMSTNLVNSRSAGA